MENGKLLGVALLGFLLMLPLAPNFEAYRFAIWKSFGFPIKQMAVNLLRVFCWRIKWGL